MRIAIDFGISNTDVVMQADGRLRRWSQPTEGPPSPELVRDLVARGGITLAQLQGLAVTGGQHRLLPTVIDGCPIIPVGELTAIGRGGQALADEIGLSYGTPLIVVSAGSGTAVVAARVGEYAHVTGTGVGGGTLQGLGRLILQTTNVTEIDQLALIGDPNGADLALQDVVTGPLGSLPASATAVNFGRLAQHAVEVRREDLAAALVTLVSQVIAITVINAARAQQIPHIVVIGHLTDMRSIRNVLARVGAYYGQELLLVEHAGYGTAVGALMASSQP